MTRKHFLGLVAFATIVAASCTKPPKPLHTKVFDVQSVSRISAGDNFKVIIEQGSAPSFSATGTFEDVNEVRLTNVNGVLQVDYSVPRNNRRSVTLHITMPELRHARLYGAASGSVTTTSRTVFNLVAGDAASIHFYGNVSRLQLALSSAGKIKVHQSADSLIAALDGASSLEAFDAQSRVADVYTASSAKAYVTAGETLIAMATGNSRIYYKGNPVLKDIVEEGTSRVVQQ